MKKELLPIKSIFPRGYSLVEIILATALFALLVTTFVGVLVYGVESSAVAGKRTRAAFVAEEMVEAARNVRDGSFDNLTSGTHGLAVSGNQWVFSGSTDTVDIFSRSLTLAPIGTQRFTATTTVDWVQTAQRTASINVETYYTNWQRDFANWATATQQSSLDFTGASNGFKVVLYQTGSNIYAVTVRNSSVNPELFIVDITDPASLVTVGSLELGADGNDLAISGTTVVVATNSNTEEFMVVDISSVTAPSLVGSLNLAGSTDAKSIAVSGSTAFLGRLVSGDPEIYAVSIATPSAPSLLSSLNLSGDATSVAVAQDASLLYVSTSSNTEELHIISASDPSSISSLGTYNATGNADGTAVTVFDQYAVLGRDDGNIEVISLATPSTPVLVGGPLDLGSVVNDLAMGVGDIYIFAATSTGGTPTKVVDVSTLSSPTILQHVSLAGNSTGVMWVYDLNRAIVTGTANTEEIQCVQPN